MSHTSWSQKWKCACERAMKKRFAFEYESSFTLIIFKNWHYLTVLPTVKKLFCTAGSLKFGYLSSVCLQQPFFALNLNLLETVSCQFREILSLFNVELHKYILNFSSISRLTMTEWRAANIDYLLHVEVCNLHLNLVSHLIYVTCFHKMSAKSSVCIQRYSLLDMSQNNRKQKKINTK